jgi:raffinose/stachyose/melibiose transport system substrate-binding protein
MRRRRAIAGLAALVLVGVLAIGESGSQARPQDNVTIRVFVQQGQKDMFETTLIPAFQRVHPNIKVDMSYGGTGAEINRLITTQLAAGTAPDAFITWPGCGTAISICKLAKAGHLQAMVNKQWALRSNPLTISASKFKSGLFNFSPTVTFDGLWINDTLFAKLKLKVPQTFAQLLDTCAKVKASAPDTIPLMLAAQGSLVIQQLVADIALTTVYARDPKWLNKLKAGKVTFAGTPGWRQALNEVVAMKNAGCFQQGAAALTSPAGDVMFGQGRALMYVCLTSHKNVIDANLQIKYSQQPFPAPRGVAPDKTYVLLNLSLGLAVNAHSSPERQVAAQTFIDFLAQPKQNETFARITGGVSHQQFAKQQLPGYLSTFRARFKNHKYGVNPIETFWNADTGDALTKYGTGLITGQNTVDDVLEAMDDAWKKGPDYAD